MSYIYVFKNEYDNGCDRVDYNIDYILSHEQCYSKEDLDKFKTTWEKEVLSKPIDYKTHFYISFATWLTHKHGFSLHNWMDYDSP